MKTGKDIDGGEWRVRDRIHGLGSVVFVPNGALILDANQSRELAASILEEAGEVELAKMVREKVGT